MRPSKRLPDWRIESLGAYFAYVRHPFGGTDAACGGGTALAADLRCALPTRPRVRARTGKRHLRLAFANVPMTAAIGHLTESPIELPARGLRGGT